MLNSIMPASIVGSTGGILLTQTNLRQRDIIAVLRNIRKTKTPIYTSFFEDGTSPKFEMRLCSAGIFMGRPEKEDILFGYTFNLKDNWPAVSNVTKWSEKVVAKRSADSELSEKIIDGLSKDYIINIKKVTSEFPDTGFSGFCDVLSISVIKRSGH